MATTYPTNSKNGAENLVAFALAVRTQCQTLLSNQGTLSSLTTTEKGSLVGAIDELVTSVADIKAKIEAKSEIDDTKSTKTNAWSAVKIANEISTASTNLKNELLGGAGEAYDTLKELADLIATNKTAIEALEALAAGHVKFDGAQTLTDAQKTQARSNIGAAAASHTHAISEITNLQTTLDAKATKAEVGDTTIDLASIFNNGASA